ncbi:hypothetical protein PPL_10318 [Heterostelium album PN500]|uniref:Uncharacterized protein n=1 Tax=Heterostelium pallidum (strain ATCC 26659 / Pp 5 / PN500) TaxID=670386 RepID=D3BPZ8_HETP5|nr:hypothetical protein PPL_10318 [Heterostelium album PN500]EFA76549.1 hypothetical protein PPL_10318 [Heterostelium album PN500]|eukprot:XP_020428681.1 hypothetical protein PPL_10318 [Heterostelium album PN500]
MKFIYLIYILFVVFGICKSSQLYVDSGIKANTMPCGDTPQNACLDIVTALSVYTNANSTDALTLLLASGTYSGVNNTDISLVNITLTITSANTNSIATIDMKGEAGFIIIGDTVNATNVNLTVSYLSLANGLGGVVNINVTNVNVNVVLDNVAATNNHNYNGGVFNVLTGGDARFSVSVAISNSVLNNNTATNSGAVYYTQSYGSLTVTNSVMNNNIALSTGILYLIFSDISINNLTMSGNKANSTLFALANALDTANINSLTYTNNKLSSNGGSHIKVLDTDIVITNSVFSDNNGGSVIQLKLSDINDDTLTINNCSFTQNSSPTIGVLYLDNNANLNMTNSVFTNNFANGSGGSIYEKLANFARVTNTIFNNSNIGIGEFGSTVYSYYTDDIYTNVTFITKSTVSTPFYCHRSRMTFNNITTNSKSLLSCANEELCIISGNEDIKCSGKDSPSSEASSENEPKKKDGLTNGQIAGIVIGVILGVAFVILIIYILYKRHHNRHKYTSYH